MLHEKNQQQQMKVAIVNQMNNDINFVVFTAFTAIEIFTLKICCSTQDQTESKMFVGVDNNSSTLQFE